MHGQLPLISAVFLAMKSCASVIESLRFKLRILFGVPIDGSVHVFCGNENAANNSSKVELTLDKKVQFYSIPSC